MVKAPPKDLKPPAAARWRAVYPELAKRGAVDLEQLRTYCQVWARWRQAEDGIEKAGQLVQGPGGRVVPSPLVAIANATAREVRALEDRLGMGGAAPASGDGSSQAADGARAVAKGALGWRRVNRIQLGELMGVHPDTVTDYTRQGMPVLTAGGGGREGVYDCVACLDWWRQRQGRNARENAQTRAYNASADLQELRLEKERGLVLPLELVALEGQAYTKAWRAKIRSLARRLVQLAIVPRDAERAIGDACDDILRDIAEWKTVGDLQQADQDSHAT